MKAIDYTLILHRDSSKLAKDVKAYLREGWDLHGQPFVLNKAIGQALVKSETTTAENVAPSTLSRIKAPDDRN
jgi:hypothetical protein